MNSGLLLSRWAPMLLAGASLLALAGTPSLTSAQGQAVDSAATPQDARDSERAFAPPLGAQGTGIADRAVPAAGEPPVYRSNPPAQLAPPLESAPRRANYFPGRADEAIVLSSGNSRIFDFASRLTRVSIADTKVADVQVINPFQVNLVGHAPGFTTVAIWDNQGRYEERQIRVDPFGKQQVLLNVIVAELDRSRLESQAINWSGALSNYNVSLLGIGPGGAATPYSPETDLAPSTVFGLGSANSTTVSSGVTGTVPPAGQLIPLLLSSAINYGLSWGNSVAQTQAFFNFLEAHDLAKVLAEPHLLANSGEKAEFLSGGEIPIVISQNFNTSIEYKQFGASVVFTPTVVGRDLIELNVRPEVSEPDYTHAVALFGFTVPAFVTRRAQTVVRLKNNQTLIVAGLILRSKTSEVQKTPYLGDLPYLGNLFKRTSYSSQTTDLVITVTPQIVAPIPAGGQVATPVQRAPLSPDEIRTQRLSQPDASRPRF